MRCHMYATFINLEFFKVLYCSWLSQSRFPFSNRSLEGYLKKYHNIASNSKVT